jgi:serine/threonine protein kinase
VAAEGLAIHEEIGRGGFAVVYRAHDTDFGRDVAVKVLQTRLDDDGLARFQRECAAVGAISNHPNIVAVHRSGVTDDGKAYLVMELLTGGSLASRASSDRFPWRQAVALGVALAGALETAHRAGVLHRDVKPENILFSAFQAPVLVDFGIAAVRGGYETRSSAITASLAHAAPEVVAGSRASAASDVYALASTVFFALSGRAPFSDDADETLVPLIARIATAPPPDLRVFGVPDGVAAVVETALAKDAGSRPVTAEAFAAALVDAAAEAGAEIAPAVLPTVSATGAVSIGDSATGIVGRRRDARTAPPVPVARPSRRRGVLVGAVATTALLLVGGGAWALTSGEGTPDVKAVADSVPTATTSASGSTAPTSGAARSPSAKATRSKPASSQNQPLPVAPDQPATSAAQPVAPPANRAPSLAAISGKQNDERAGVSVRASGSDPDGDRLTYSASGLPSGLHMSSSTGTISGTVSHNAASGTSTRTNLVTKAFSVTVRVSDGKKSALRTFTWRIRDTHRTMPNYYGKYGCGPGCGESAPDVADLSIPGFFCTTNGSVKDETIAAQSVASGAVIRWGQRVNYTYKRASC